MSKGKDTDIEPDACSNVLSSQSAKDTVDSAIVIDIDQKVPREVYELCSSSPPRVFNQWRKSVKE